MKSLFNLLDTPEIDAMIAPDKLEEGFRYFRTDGLDNSKERIVVYVSKPHYVVWVAGDNRCYWGSLDSDGKPLKYSGFSPVTEEQRNTGKNFLSGVLH